MTETINLICFNCIHWRLAAMGCDAFPEGIPDQILLRNQHSKPIKGQKNKIVFEEGKQQARVDRYISMKKQGEEIPIEEVEGEDVQAANARAWAIINAEEKSIKKVLTKADKKRLVNKMSSAGC